MEYPRGHVEGGSSSINYMAYTRGSTNEFDRIAAVSGDPGWSWDKMFRYFLKSERHVASSDGHNTTGQYNPAVHGNGPLLTSLPGNPTDIDARVLSTTQELASEFPFNLEMNSGRPLGVGWLQSTVGNSVRSSAATAYLDPVTSTRSNIDVLLNTHATRLIQSGASKSGPIFRTLEYAQDATSPRKTITAQKEIILSGGSIATPQLLMLSGIGDPKALAAQKIKCAVNLPDVGNNLQDHPFFTLQWSVNSTSTFDNVAFNQTAFEQALDQYEETKTGLFANNAIANHIGFFRLPQNSSALKSGDPSAGPLTPHYEFAFSNGFVGTTQTGPTSGNYFSTSVILITPTSRGAVTLTSSSVFDQPAINPNFLSTQFDILTVVEAVKALKRFLSATAWRGYIEQPFGETANITTDADIEAYARKWSISIRHPVATARISTRTSKTGVVGPDLLVKNTQGLRIVDASVLPFAIAGHPQAAIYAIAERAADLVKASHGLV